MSSGREAPRRPTEEADTRKRLSVRLLVAALAVQVLLFGALILFVLPAVTDLFDDPAEPVRATTSASATAPVAAAAAPATRARPGFDATRALKLVRLQVAYGQRPAGSAVLRRVAAKELRPRLPGGRFEDLPKNPGLRNVVGVLPGRKPALVIGAHYDTESHPPGFVGANDSAAGTAAVLELARAIRAEGRPTGARELRFVLFDGEEEPTEADNSDFYRYALRGSKAYVAAHKKEIRAFVLLDYIANTGLQLPREATSNEGLWARLRAAATTAGKVQTFPDVVGGGVYDDHTPFLRAGIPSIDLIDFTYAYADGLQDTPDKLSAGAMDATGESVLQLVRDLDASGY